MINLAAVILSDGGKNLYMPKEICTHQAHTHTSALNFHDILRSANNGSGQSVAFKKRILKMIKLTF